MAFFAFLLCHWQLWRYRSLQYCGRSSVHFVSSFLRIRLSLVLLFVCLFVGHRLACGIPVPGPGVEFRWCSEKAQNPNHQIIRKLPEFQGFRAGYQIRAPVSPLLYHRKRTASRLISSLVRLTLINGVCQLSVHCQITNFPLANVIMRPAGQVLRWGEQGT